MKINDRISAIRSSLKAHNADALIIPSSDPHQSEYVADHWQSRTWASGFTGSAAVAIITHKHAGLWTDSRYFIQAEKQLATSAYVLHKQKVSLREEYLDWLIDNLPAESVVGCDGWMFSQEEIAGIEQRLKENNIQLRTDLDLISPNWKDRPALPQNRILELNSAQVGQSRETKIQLIRKEMVKKNVQHLLVSTLDDLCWILNFRGTDIPNNPVAIAYLLIHQDSSSIFVDAAKLDVKLIGQLDREAIQVLPYDKVQGHLEELDAQDAIWVDAANLSFPLYNAIACKKHTETLPSTLMKGMKNKAEIQFTREAMKKDGVALVKLFRWMEATLDKRSIPETEVAEKLIEFRSAQEGYHCESFPAIVGYQGNGAIVHYRATKESHAAIKKEGILLLDSGGQYIEGTTDITRTIALGPTTEQQRLHFTLVLKGCINLDMAIFPKGTSGHSLDILARKPLWSHGLNYGHGTGHGVGFFLNVHEGPQSISPVNSKKSRQEFLPGMITSDEPGFYLTNEYGIRIENLILCQPYRETDFGEFYHFETLTLFPIDLSLIDMNLLNSEEQKWLTDYHKKVFTTLQPLLNREETDWLKEKCGQ